MSLRRACTLALMIYFLFDLSSPWLPGIFFFDDGGFFIDTVVEAKAKPVRLGTEVSAPRAMVLVARDDQTALPRTTQLSRDPEVRDPRPGPLRSIRSSLAPPSLDDH
jgi:hypothetical protein